MLGRHIQNVQRQSGFFMRLLTSVWMCLYIMHLRVHRDSPLAPVFRLSFKLSDFSEQFSASTFKDTASMQVCGSNYLWIRNWLVCLTASLSASFCCVEVSLKSSFWSLSACPSSPGFLWGLWVNEKLINNYVIKIKIKNKCTVNWNKVEIGIWLVWLLNHKGSNLVWCTASS